jgi:hypothetical protein
MLAPLLILVGCFAHGGGAPVDPPPVTVPTPSPGSEEAPVSFVALEQRVNDLLGATTDADQRDRLIALRELLFNLRGREPAAQRAVYAYASRQLDIEARARPQPIELGGAAPVEEELLDEAPAAPRVAPAPTGGRANPPAAPGVVALPAVAPPTGGLALPVAPIGSAVPTASPQDALSAAREALASNRPLDAVAALEGLVSAEAATLRREAADAWARAEREAAGHAFLEARGSADAGSRLSAITSVRDRLAAINARFPDNAHAADIRTNLARVQAELDALQGSPR